MVVGLPDTAVREGTDRVLLSITSSALLWPRGLPENPGHAEVMPRVPTGLARYLLDKIKFFDLKLDDAA